MSIDEMKNRPESDNRAIHESSCTIYVGRVRVIIDPHFNADVSGIAEKHATENYHEGPATNTPPILTDFVDVCNTKPCSQHQPNTTPYSAQPKISKTKLTSQQSACLRPTTSQLSCCLHGSGRCNYEARFGTGNDNCIVGTDNCNTAALNNYQSCRNSSGRSPISEAQNDGRLSSRSLVFRNLGVMKSDWTTPSRKSAVPSSSRPKPLARQDRPVDLYVGSRLPVPVRPGPVTARIPRIGRAGDVRLPSRGNNQNGSRCTSADRPHHTDDGLNNGHRCSTADMMNYTDDDLNGQCCAISDKPHDHDDMQHGTANGPHDTDDRLNDMYNVVGSLDYNDMTVVPGQSSMCIDKSGVRTSTTRQVLNQWPLTSDSLSDTSNHPSLQQVRRNGPGNQCVSLFTDDILT